MQFPPHSPRMPPTLPVNAACMTETPSGTSIFVGIPVEEIYVTLGIRAP